MTYQVSILTSLKVCDCGTHFRRYKKMAMSPSSTAVHGGGQHDTEYVTFELLMHAAFVTDEIGVLCLNQLVLHAAFLVDEIWGDTLEPTRFFFPFANCLQVARCPLPNAHSLFRRVFRGHQTTSSHTT